MTGFNDSYFTHYCFFDIEQETPYCKTENRFFGNRDIHKFLIGTYKYLFRKYPNSYIDLGCGTGEEIEYFLNKGLKCSGCDFSDYVFKHINKKAEPFIKKQDSISFLNELEWKADIAMDSVLQYLGDDDFEKQLEMMDMKLSDECVIGIIFDLTDRKHPYRKQVHDYDWWTKKLNEYGFVSMSSIGFSITNNNEDYLSDYIFFRK